MGGLFFGKPSSIILFYFSFFLFLFLILKQKNKNFFSFFQVLLYASTFYFTSLIWLVKFLKVYAGFSFIFASLAIFALSLYLSLYFSFSFLLSKFFPEKFFLYIFPLFFWIFEYLRGIVFTGFPWNPIHLPLGYFPFSVQGLAFFGGYGFSAVVLFFFLGLCYQIMEKKINFIWLIFFLALNIFNFLWISHHIKEDRLNICLIQVQIDEFERFVYGESYEGLEKGLRHSADVQKDVDLLVFPESLFLTIYRKDNFIFNDLNKLSLKLPILFNANLEEGGKTFNSAVLLHREEIIKIYRKNHLVPFGEYIPLRSIFESIGFKKIARSLLDFDKGKETGIFTFPRNFGVSICYEIIFPEISRRELNEGASFLVVLTNDSWYGNSLGPYQHFLLAQLKGVEFHRPVVRAALTGISGFIDSHGRVISRMGLWEEGILCSKIEVSNRRTPYFFLKDYPPFILLMGIFVFLVLKKVIKN